MMNGVDWSAPIEPGRAILGLTLGTRVEAVRQQLGIGCEVLCEEISFANSPRVLIDCQKKDVIYIRISDMKEISYEWQDIFARLIFDQGVLKSIVVLTHLDDEPYQYQGKLFESIGLGSKVIDLLNYDLIHYDESDEIFFFDTIQGIEVGGTSKCDLSEDSDQAITFIRVFQ